MGRLGIVVWMVAVVASSASAIALAAGEHGTDHADKLVGTKGGDVLKGLRGHDVLIGGKGPDQLRGGPGRDSYNMRDGVLLAAPGRDKIDARDGGNDEINCGAGKDVAIVDSTEDGVYDCEVVREPKP